MRTLRVMLLLVAAGCSTEAVVSDPPVQISDLPPTASSGAPAPSLKAEAGVCHVDAWTTPSGAGREVQLAVVPLAQGAALFSVPKAGGPLTGFAIDQYGLITTNPAGETVREGNFNSVHAGWVDGRIVTAVSDGKSLQVDAVSNDLVSHAKLAALLGTYSAQVPILHARDLRVMPTASADGVSYSTFDDQWQETHSTFALPSTGTIGMDAAQLRGDTGDTVVAWSSRNECQVERLLAQEWQTTPEPCASPHFASVGGGRAELFFESLGRVGQYNVTGAAGDLKGATFFPELGTSPRAVFDGTRTWLSYLDVHGQVLAGFLDESGGFVHTAIDQTPTHDAYELAIVDGAPWVFTANETGYYAYEMCVTEH
jgi:hypothetical protein